MKRNFLVGVGFLLGIGLVSVLYIGWVKTQSTFRGALIEPPYPAADFILQSDKGEVHLSDYRGKIVLLYFGYTFCPDVCPATMAKIAQAYHSLGQDASHVQTIFISVDPERDTPDKLGRYVRAFNPTFVGATSTPETISELAKKYGVFFQKRTVNSAAGYLVDHTAIVWVIDTQGKLHVEWPYDIISDDMVADIRLLMKSR